MNTGAPNSPIRAVSAHTASGPLLISRGCASPRLPCKGLWPKRGPINNVRFAPSPASFPMKTVVIEHVYIITLCRGMQELFLATPPRWGVAEGWGLTQASCRRAASPIVELAQYVIWQRVVKIIGNAALRRDFATEVTV